MKADQTSFCHKISFKLFQFIQMILFVQIYGVKSSQSEKKRLYIIFFILKQI